MTERGRVQVLPVQCRVPGCPRKASHSGRCREHGWSWKGNPMPPGWGKRRATVLAEEPTCRLCGRPASTVDHAVPREFGGGEERTNLRPLCARCHTAKTHRDSVEGQRRARERRR